MLAYLLSLMSIKTSHRVANRLGIYDGLHNWLHGFCPCQADEEDIFDLG